jgi:hypothetical protein
LTPTRSGARHATAQGRIAPSASSLNSAGTKLFVGTSKQAPSGDALRNVQVMTELRRLKTILAALYLGCRIAALRSFMPLLPACYGPSMVEQYKFNACAPEFAGGPN